MSSVPPVLVSVKTFFNIKILLPLFTKYLIGLWTYLLLWHISIPFL